MPTCIFCEYSSIAGYVLKETPAFRIVADHAPLLEGHLLIMPKQHYACYGATPTELDDELLLLKEEIEHFFGRFYAAPVFWEHGVFRQTVFHSHLHCLPFGKIHYPAAETRHSLVVSSQDDVRAWYAACGHYFYMGDPQQAFLFAPDLANYMHVIQAVLRSNVNTHYPQQAWRSSLQRQSEGVPLIASLKANWQHFHH